MKYLLINNGKAFYKTSETASSDSPIDEITKDDLLKLVDLCLSLDDFEMDPYDESTLHNKAHQIIYRNIYNKLFDVRNKRVAFSDEKTTLYRKAIDDYSTELSSFPNDTEVSNNLDV